MNNIIMTLHYEGLTIVKLEKAMNKLDNCIDDCSQETADAISEVYSLIDDLKKGV
jgi:hypothetical protein